MHPAADLAGMYLRISDEPPDRESTSPESQRTLCERRAQDLGLSVIKEFRDIDAPARKNSRRPGFEAAVKALLERRISTLLVAKLDRLDRRGMGQVGLLLDDLEEVGGRVIFVREGIDTSQPGARPYIGFLSEVAREESDAISWRVKQWREHGRQNGKWCAARPFGFIVQDGKLKPHPVEAEIVRRMVKKFLRGESLRSIAVMLNEEGIKAHKAAIAAEAKARGRKVKTPKTDRWSLISVRQILKNPVLVGLQTHNGTIVRDEHGNPIPVGEGILSFAEHARVVKELERRTAVVRKAQDPARIGGRTGGGRPPKYLLTGFIRCGMCGAAMAGTRANSRQGATYRCTKASRGQCGGVMAMVEYLDAEVMHRFTAKLAALEPGDPLLDHIAKRWLQLTMPGDEADRSILEVSLEDAKAAIADLEEARYLRREFDGDGGFERYQQLHKRLLEKRKTVKAALDELGPRPVQDITPLLNTVASREAWDEMSLHQRRSLLSLAVDKVNVERSERRSIKLHDRVEVLWADAEEDEVYEEGE